MNYKHGLTNRIKKCGSCGKEFVAKKDYANRSQLYCSRKCYGVSLKKWKVCKQCGIKFNNCHNETFCSNKCSAESKKGIKTGRKQIREGELNYTHTIWNCANCGKQFKSVGAYKGRIPKYCSRSCASISKIGRHFKYKKRKTSWNKGVHMWVDKPHPKGMQGMKFPNRELLTDEQRENLSISHRGLKYPSHSGKNNHFWKGGITPENEKQRKSSEYRNWRLAVFERDLYTCQDCKKSGGYLHPHHINEFSEYPELRFDPQNGVTLCMDCHAKRHGLVFSIKALNRCPDCGKRIKVGAKRCLPCQKINTGLKYKLKIERIEHGR